jgi:hypothetical protein
MMGNKCMLLRKLFFCVLFAKNNIKCNWGTVHQ